MTINISNGDCLKLMKDIPDKSVDLFICDLPYGETNCKWDSKIDLEEFWIQFKRIRKSKKVACIHFCSTKFGYTLIKSNEAMFKMDMVWKKRNKTGGLQSRHRPMRNHEMVYFFYEQAPKYNRDKYHKRIQAKLPIIKDDKQIFAKGYEKGKEPPFCKSKFFEPPNPASVISEAEREEKSQKEQGRKNKTIKAKDRKSMGEQSGIYAKENQTASNFEPPNPASVISEAERPESLEKDERINEKGKSPHGWDIEHMDKPRIAHFDPKLPLSIVEEPESPEPVSMFESKKVFIGKRHHQTEKPLDILEFFIKYWTDEGQTILDPTMGSGSTGVACKTLKRNFIGFEMDEKIYKVAEERIKKVETII